MTTSTAPTVADASKHLWEALSHHQLTLDLGAHDPLVQAVSGYGQACRQHKGKHAAYGHGGMVHRCLLSFLRWLTCTK